MTVFVDYIEPLCALERRQWGGGGGGGGDIVETSLDVAWMYAILAAHNIGARIRVGLTSLFFTLAKVRRWALVSRHFLFPSVIERHRASSSVVDPPRDNTRSTIYFTFRESASPLVGLSRGR
jgi:hypothetical protein